ncbi:MAG: methyltransferase [Epsilonproteobacteria bacterium]|nr:methyltransferase [Campylobacterota bacterium]
MKIVQEFSRFANQYESHNIIQAEVAKKLVAMVDGDSYDMVVDIGCGSGAVYKNILARKIEFHKFLALDFSQKMLDIHPVSPALQKICFDFNSPINFKNLKVSKSNVILSSSALQWSSDLELTLKEISKLSHEFYFAMFTSNTFRTLHQLANVESPIYTIKEMVTIIDKYYNAEFQTVSYKLSFNSVREMFQYIKKSGVSGGEKQLGYKEMKKLMKDYPYDYLEFEVLFIKATT